MALIIPDIYAPLVREKFEGRIKVATLCSDLGYLANTTVGETVTFPKWKAIGDASDVEKGTPVEVESLDQDGSTATIKQVAPKAVRIYDMDNLTAIGNAIDEAATQQAIVIARKLDKDLITEALTSDLQSATAAADEITATEVNTALSLFGDEQDTQDFSGIVINSNLLTSFLAMDEFTSVEKTYTTNGSGIIKNGTVGYFRGIPVIMTDHCTYDSTLQEYLTFVIKKGSLGYMTKRDVNVQIDRQPKLFATDIVTDMIYAVKLVNDEGIVVIRKTITEPEEPEEP